MHRRLFILGAAVAGACAPTMEALPPSPAFVVELAAETVIESVPAGSLYWRIEALPTLQAAQAELGATSLAAEISGRAWRFTLGARGERTAGATFVAEIGRVPRIQARRYRLRINHAQAPVGTATTVHTHPGSEAFYVLTGELSQRSRHGIARARAGEAMNGHMPGMVMQLQSTGAEPLDQIVLFVVDADQPFSSPASF